MTKLKKGDLVYKKGIFSHKRDIYVVISLQRNTVLCAIPSINLQNLMLVTIPKKDVEKYVVKYIRVSVSTLELMKRIGEGYGTKQVVYGPLNKSWEALTISPKNPSVDIVKIGDCDGNCAYFEYIEAGRRYWNGPTQIKLEVGKMLLIDPKRCLQ